MFFAKKGDDCEGVTISGKKCERTPDTELPKDRYFNITDLCVAMTRMKFSSGKRSGRKSGRRPTIAPGEPEFMSQSDASMVQTPPIAHKCESLERTRNSYRYKQGVIVGDHRLGISTAWACLSCSKTF